MLTLGMSHKEIRVLNRWLPTSRAKQRLQMLLNTEPANKHKNNRPTTTMKGGSLPKIDEYVSVTNRPIKGHDTHHRKNLFFQRRTSFQ